MKTIMAAILTVGLWSAGAFRAAAETEALAPNTPWRVFLVCSQQDKHKKASVVSYTAAPPVEWTQPDYDDSGWGRYGDDLNAAVGGYGYDQTGNSALLCLRTRFGVSDPAQAKDLTLALEYRGGAVVYVNGKEVARQHLPKDKLELQTPAEQYPAEAFTDAGGQPLQKSDRPATENKDRYEQRIRRLSVVLPSESLRKGSNALAIELHHAPIKVQAGGKSEFNLCGMSGVKLSSRSGAGVIAYPDALKEPVVWNADPLETVAVTPGKRQAGFLWWGITITPVGLKCGNPFEPLQPIRAVAPRGGTCSGQVVVSAAAPFSGLKAAVGPLKHAGSGAALPAEAVQVRYATQAKDEMFCNALMPQPADGVAVQPVWVLVDVPREQAPGWYTGALELTAGPRKVRVPVQVLVAGWTLTDPKDNATLVSLYQSPDTLVEHYKVEPWSDRHFALIEKSFSTMARMGNDVLLVPVIIDNYLHHKVGLVRWVKKGAGYEPEFSAFEKYLDLHLKHFGKPKMVTLSIWKHDFGTRAWFRGMKSDKVGPCMVTQLDGAGKMTPLQAPHFGEAGSEEFWKPMIEGVRQRIKARGCDDKFLLLGEPFDSRPLQPVVDFFKKIEPDLRWQIYAHWVGDPPPKDGKCSAMGGFEVGFRITPGGSGLPEFRRDYPNVEAGNYYVAETNRTEIHYTSSPLSYRNVMRDSGTTARIGLDFWVLFQDRGRLRSYYGCPPNEGWLWRGHCPTLTAPGPEGAVITSRGQMILESVQETEVLVSLIRAKQKASPEIQARIGKLMSDRQHAAVVGKALSQAAISLDWNGMAAREYALAAELAGATSEGDWRKPPAPAVEGGAK